MNDKQIKKYLKESIDLQIDLETGQETKEWAKRLGNHFASFPKKLYKYVKLNRFTFDSINREYIYLCPANRLDDQFECKIKDTSLKKLKWAKDEQTIFNHLLKVIRELLSNRHIPLSDEQIAFIMDDCHYSLPSEKPTIASIADKIGYNLSDEEVAACKKIEESNLEEKGAEIFINLYSKINNFKKDNGIGSLTECKRSQVMWEMYADHYKGICIEYELFNNSDIFLSTFPVKYSKKRENDLLKISLGVVIDSYISGLSAGMIKQTKNTLSIIEILLTKYTEWSFQKEWRIVGQPKAKIRGPKIKRIFVGKNVSKKKYEKLYKIANEKSIKLFRQYDDEESLQIKYTPIE